MIHNSTCFLPLKKCLLASPKGDATADGIHALSIYDNDDDEEIRQLLLFLFPHPWDSSVIPAPRCVVFINIANMRFSSYRYIVFFNFFFPIHFS